jgi:hypothetical protein
LIISVGSNLAQVPLSAVEAAFAEDAPGQWDYCSVVIDSERLFVAAYPGFGASYTIASIDRQSGQLLWTAWVWGAGRTILNGQGYHDVALQQQGDVLLLFGAESHGMYVEAFRANTGENVFRFCTGYWFHFSEEWDWSK